MRTCLTEPVQLRSMISSTTNLLLTKMITVRRVAPIRQILIIKQMARIVRVDQKRRVHPKVRTGLSCVSIVISQVTLLEIVGSLGGHLRL